MKRWLRRNLPNPRAIRENRNLSVFGKLLHDPNLWHLNRRSAAGAFGVGLFMMYMPPIGQMLMAAAAAIVLRVNLPISVALVWITNPLTIPPMFYFAYKVGAWVLGQAPHQVNIQLSLAWVMHEMALIWQPLLLGSFIVGMTGGALSYAAIRLLWRWHVISHLRKRAERRRDV